MRLIECYVTGFGKLRDRKYQFANGLNTVEAENGSGKTTLTYFIKAMLYGIGDTKKASLEENDRKHYLPWDGGAAGGSLTFEVGGKVYRAERSFGKRHSEDKFKLYDVMLGRESGDYTENLGEELFGIDADGFERTVFLSERSLSPKSDNVTVTAKLSDLADADADLGTLDEAMKILADQRRFYSKRGGNGQISEIEGRITECEERLAVIEECEARIAQAEARLLALDGEASELEQHEAALAREREALTMRAARETYAKKLGEMQEELRKITEKRDTLLTFFSGSIPSYTELSEANYKRTEAAKLLSGRSDINAKSSELNSLKSLFEYRTTKEEVEEARGALYALERDDRRERSEKELKARGFFDKRIPRREEIDSVKARCSEIKAERGSVSTVLLLLLGIVLIGIGVVLGATTDVAFYGVAVAGILFITFSIVVRSATIKKKRKRSDAVIRELLSSVTSSYIPDAEIERVLGEAETLLSHVDPQYEKNGRYERILLEFNAKFFTRVGANAVSAAKELIEKYDRYTTLLASEAYINADLRESIARGKALEQEAAEFFGKYDTAGGDPYIVISEKLAEYSSLTSDIVSRRQQIAAFESMNYIGGGKDRTADASDINARASMLKAENDRISSERALLERQRREDLEEAEMREAVTSERDALIEKRQRYQRQLRIIQLAEQYLVNAKEKMTSKYLGKTQAAFEKYTALVSGSGDGRFEMDSSFGISKLEGGVTRSTDAYSRGYRDLYRLAARLSLIDSLYEKETPFLILDDPFIAFDDRRIASALGLLASLSEDRQILYFTCSKSRKP